MKKIITTTIGFLVLSLAGCGTTEPAPADPSTTTSTSSTASTTSSATTATTPTSTETASAPAEVEQTAAAGEGATPIPAAPTFDKCWENEAALMSDGSIIHDPVNCKSDPEGVYSIPDDALLAEYFAEQERLANIPFANGGTCAAYKCGYGTNSQGQPNPTSGEIQTLHGCQDGYITDPHLCEAVVWVETHQY